MPSTISSGMRFSGFGHNTCLMDNVPPQSSRSTKDLRPVRDSCFTDTVLSGDVVVVVVAAVGGGGGVVAVVDVVAVVVLLLAKA